MPTELSEIAKELDAAELSAMLEGNPQNRDAIQAEFVKNGSNNFDDTGFFSVAVIEKALQVFQLQLLNFNHPDSVSARNTPESEMAYILNLNEHWFTLRKFGGSARRWYDLNSTLSAPKFVSQTYLGMLLDQMKTEGYSIFIVTGTMPNSEADDIAQTIPVPPPEALRVERKSASEVELEKAIKMSLGEESDHDLHQAIQMSLQDDNGSKALAQALEASLKDNITSSSADLEEIRRRRLNRFG